MIAKFLKTNLKMLKKKDNYKLKKIFFIFIYFISGFYAPIIFSSIINTSLFVLGSIFYYVVYFPLQFFGLEQKLSSLLILYILIIVIVGLLLQFRIFYSSIPNFENYANYKFKKLTSIKYRNNFFRALIRTWWFFCYFFSGPALVILTLLAAFMPPFVNISEKAKAGAAANTLATMVKECAAKIADQGQGLITIPEVDGYKSSKKNVAGFYKGNDRKVHGATILCPTNGEMKLVSEDESELPTFSYNLDTGKKACFSDPGSDAEYSRGCKDGEW